MNQTQLAELLGVSIDSLKVWRSTRARDTPLCLVPDGVEGKQSTYSMPVILEWLQRPANETYRNRILALFAPAPIRESLLPLAIATTWAEELRNHQPIDQQPQQQLEAQQEQA
jgi:hypothetical protein